MLRVMAKGGASMGLLEGKTDNIRREVSERRLGWGRGVYRSDLNFSITKTSSSKADVTKSRDLGSRRLSHYQ